MPECIHCHKYYFGNPDQCPNCYYDFRTGLIRDPQTILKEQMKQQEERDKRIKERDKCIKEQEDQERELARRTREERSLALKSNARYEYATEYLRDSVNGMLDKSKLDYVLSKYASEGWRLHSVFTNEAGKNASSVGIGGVTVGTNSTMDVTILVFERCVKLEER